MLPARPYSDYLIASARVPNPPLDRFLLPPKDVRFPQEVPQQGTPEAAICLQKRYVWEKIGVLPRMP